MGRVRFHVLMTSSAKSGFRLKHLLMVALTGLIGSNNCNANFRIVEFSVWNFITSQQGIDPGLSKADDRC